MAESIAAGAGTPTTGRTIPLMLMAAQGPESSGTLGPDDRTHVRSQTHGPQPPVYASGRSHLYSALDPTVQAGPDPPRGHPPHHRSRGEGAEWWQPAGRAISRRERSRQDRIVRRALPR